MPASIKHRKRMLQHLEEQQREAQTITVRKHKGRSGKSVFEYRVYSEGLFNGVKPYRFQLAKFRTQKGAERAAAHYRLRPTELEGKRQCG